MAPKRNLQQSLDAPVAKRNGKKIADPVTEKSKEEDLASLQSVAVMKDIPESSIKQDSSSESNIEDEEGLDAWEREARRLYVPKVDDKEWLPWSPRQEMIIFVGACHAKAVLEAQLAVEQQMSTKQGTEDSESAQIPQDDKAQEQDDTDIDQIGTDVAPLTPVDADVQDVSVVPPTSEDIPAIVDASDAVADPSPIPPDNN